MNQVPLNLGDQQKPWKPKLRAWPLCADRTCHRQEGKKGGYTQATCQLQGHASDSGEVRRAWITWRQCSDFRSGHKSCQEWAMLCEDCRLREGFWCAFGKTCRGRDSNHLHCACGRSFGGDAQTGCPLGRECQGTVCGQDKREEEKPRGF